MDLMQVLMEEYKMLGQVGEKYFDRLYQSLYFTIVFYRMQYFIKPTPTPHRFIICALPKEKRMAT